MSMVQDVVNQVIRFRNCKFLCLEILCNSSVRFNCNGSFAWSVITEDDSVIAALNYTVNVIELWQRLLHTIHGEISVD